MPPERTYPYDFHIFMVGYFNVGEQVPPEQRESYVRLSAASMLYSAARELLATATGRGPLPCVILPAVVFTFNADKQQVEPVAELPAGDKKTRRKVAKKRVAKKVGSKKQQR